MAEELGSPPADPFARTRGPFTGEWYGTLSIGPPAPPTPIMNGAPSIQVVDAEVFLHVQQTQSTVAGAGTLCLTLTARGGPVQAPMTVADTATDARATLHWSSSGESRSTVLLGSTNLSLEATRSGGELALSGADAQSTYVAVLHQGTERQYASACAQLPPVASGD